MNLVTRNFLYRSACSPGLACVQLSWHAKLNFTWLLLCVLGFLVFGLRSHLLFFGSVSFKNQILVSLEYCCRNLHVDTCKEFNENFLLNLLRIYFVFFKKISKRALSGVKLTLSLFSVDLSVDLCALGECTLTLRFKSSFSLTFLTVLSMKSKQ